LLASIAAIDPEWASQAEVKEMIPGLLGELARVGDAGRYAILFAAIGPAAVPEALKLLGGDKPEQRGLALVALRDLGSKARDALPAVKRALKDKNAKVRQGAVEAIGQIAKGDDDLITVLAPSLIDEDNYVQLAALGALRGVDRDWKKRPQAKAGLALVLRNLSSNDPKSRARTLWALEQIGPAEGVIPALEELVQKEKDPRNLATAQFLLNNLRRVPK
jgi:HEAT repeat protein